MSASIDQDVASYYGPRTIDTMDIVSMLGRTGDEKMTKN